MPSPLLRILKKKIDNNLNSLHIFQKAQVTINKMEPKKRHHFLAQFFSAFLMVGNALQSPGSKSRAHFRPPIFAWIRIPQVYFRSTAKEDNTAPVSKALLGGI